MAKLANIKKRSQPHTDAFKPLYWNSPEAITT